MSTVTVRIHLFLGIANFWNQIEKVKQYEYCFYRTQVHLLSLRQQRATMSKSYLDAVLTFLT
jgi:hypothetical protein